MAINREYQEEADLTIQGHSAPDEDPKTEILKLFFLPELTF